MSGKDTGSLGLVVISIPNYNLLMKIGFAAFFIYLLFTDYSMYAIFFAAMFFAYTAYRYIIFMAGKNGN